MNYLYSPATRRGGRRALKRRPLGLEPLEGRQLLAVTATLGLGPATIEGLTARFPVSLEFTATAGETLTYFSLDVQPSSPQLVRPGPDYSSFSFNKATPLLDLWSQIGSFNDPGFESSVEFDDSLQAPLGTGVYVLGTLNVDFGAAGLALGDSFTVAINGPNTVIGVDDPARGFVFENVNFNPASQLVAAVTLSGASTVDEGALYSLTIAVPAHLAGDLIIDWGDGQQDTVGTANLPAGGQVTHRYLDGNRTATILVELETAPGMPRQDQCERPANEWGIHTHIPGRPHQPDNRRRAGRGQRIGACAISY